MALKNPWAYNAYFSAYSGQKKVGTFTLRTSSKTLETWERGFTAITNGDGSMVLHVAGDTMIWLNNGKRKLEVQMTLKDPAHTNDVAVFDTVTIKPGECYVFQTPSIVSNITGQSRGRRNSGNQT